MKLSKRSFDALLSVKCLLTQQGSQPVSAARIASELGISKESALKVLRPLVSSRLIRSFGGRSGGYWIDPSVERLTLLQIIEAVDGPIVGQMPLPCGDQSDQPIHMLQQVYDQAAQTVREALGQVTIAADGDLMQIEDRVAA